MGRQMILGVEAMNDVDRLRENLDLQAPDSRRIVGIALDDRDAVRAARLFAACWSAPDRSCRSKPSSAAPSPDFGT